MTTPTELLAQLKEKNLLENRPKLWWPNALSFEVVIGAILTQNTKWESVEKSLFNLRKAGIITADSNETLSNLAATQTIAPLITPSGFHNQKSPRLIKIAQNILSDFGDFETFQEAVSREWLLSQKGIGFESADSILNYACGKEVMVVDKYTYKLFAALGAEIPDYNELQSYIVSDLESNAKTLAKLYGENENLATIYARFHGKIVEAQKRKMFAKIPPDF